MDWQTIYFKMEVRDGQKWQRAAGVPILIQVVPSFLQTQAGIFWKSIFKIWDSTHNGIVIAITCGPRG
jgi:hypothetical protein